MRMDLACCCGKLPRRASALLPPDLDGALPIEPAACLRGLPLTGRNLYLGSDTTH
jgi:hypothetical protein